MGVRQDNAKTQKNGQTANHRRITSEPLTGSDSEEIITYMRKKLVTKKGTSIIEEELGKLRLEVLAENRDPEDLRRITDAIYSAVYWLDEKGFYYSLEQLLDREKLWRLYTSDPQKAEKLSMGLCNLCERGEEFAAVVADFMREYFINMDLDIRWKPVVEELLRRKPNEAIAYFLCDELEDYILESRKSDRAAGPAKDAPGSRRTDIESSFVMLRDGNEKEQIYAALNLAAMGDEAIPHLARALEGEGNALTALIRIGKTFRGTGDNRISEMVTKVTAAMMGAEDEADSAKDAVKSEELDINSLVDRLCYWDAKSRRSAAQQLSRMGDDAIPDIAKAVEGKATVMGALMSAAVMCQRQGDSSVFEMVTKITAAMSGAEGEQKGDDS